MEAHLAEQKNMIKNVFLFRNERHMVIIKATQVWLKLCIYKGTFSMYLWFFKAVHNLVQVWDPKTGVAEEEGSETSSRKRAPGPKKEHHTT